MKLLYLQMSYEIFERLNCTWTFLLDCLIILEINFLLVMFKKNLLLIVWNKYLFIFHLKWDDIFIRSIWNWAQLTTELDGLKAQACFISLKRWSDKMVDYNGNDIFVSITINFIFSCSYVNLSISLIYKLVHTTFLQTLWIKLKECNHMRFKTWFEKWVSAHKWILVKSHPWHS